MRVVNRQHQEIPSTRSQKRVKSMYYRDIFHEFGVPSNSHNDSTDERITLFSCWNRPVLEMGSLPKLLLLDFEETKIQNKAQLLQYILKDQHHEYHQGLLR
jgi:hypothetical protein